MADRDKVVYKFKSDRNRNGRARYRLEFAPTRDLTRRDVDRLSPEELEAVKKATMPNGNKLYASVGGRKKKVDETDGEPVDETEDDEIVDESEDGADESEETGDDPVDESGEPEVGAE